MWQYLPGPTRQSITAAMERMGARATAERPLAWVRLETNRQTFRHELSIRYWPGGEEPVTLGEAHPHGAWIAWHGAPDDEARRKKRSRTVTFVAVHNGARGPVSSTAPWIRAFIIPETCPQPAYKLRQIGSRTTKRCDEPVLVRCHRPAKASNKDLHHEEAFYRCRRLRGSFVDLRRPGRGAGNPGRHSVRRSQPRHPCWCRGPQRTHRRRHQGGL